MATAYTYKLLIQNEVVFSCTTYFEHKKEVKRVAKKHFHDENMEHVAGATIKYIHKKMSNKVYNNIFYKKFLWPNESFIQGPNYYRYNKHYNIDEVLDNVNINIEDNEHNFDGDIVKLTSDRYYNFKYNGIVCKKCGLKGQYFCKERRRNDKSYHFNLYGIDKNGKEMMLTKDHIIPKSKGGLDTIENYQCLCEHCNSKKGATDDNIFMNRR